MSDDITIADKLRQLADEMCDAADAIDGDDEPFLSLSIDENGGLVLSCMVGADAAPVITTRTFTEALVEETDVYEDAELAMVHESLLKAVDEYVRVRLRVGAEELAALKVNT